MLLDLAANNLDNKVTIVRAGAVDDPLVQLLRTGDEEGKCQAAMVLSRLATRVLLIVLQSCRLGPLSHCRFSWCRAYIGTRSCMPQRR